MKKTDLIKRKPDGGLADIIEFLEMTGSEAELHCLLLELRRFREDKPALIEQLKAVQSERDECHQRLANAEYQLEMAELAKFNLRAQRKAQFRARKAAEAEIKRGNAQEPVSAPKLLPEQIIEIMQDAWNEWCDDTGCYPDDFEYKNEQLFFDAGRWANLIAERVVNAAAPDRNMLRDLVDMAWNRAMESTEVPGTETADELINKVFSIPDEPIESRYSAAPAAVNYPTIPDGWKLVPIEPTEGMVIDGFESEPNEFFSDEKVWKAYEAMSGCRQAAERARLCWAAMLAAAPEPEGK